MIAATAGNPFPGARSPLTRAVRRSGSRKAVAHVRHSDCVADVSQSVTRIISDVHFRDPASWVQETSSLRPLLDGVNRMVVNGDLMDTQVLDEPAAVVSELKSFFAANVPETIYITGNHDPDISDLHEWSARDGQVWLTHGDVLYDNVAPWGQLAGEIARRVQVHTARLSPGEFARIETRLRIFRQACLNLPREHDPSKRGLWAKLRRMAAATFPPHRVLIMLAVWRAMPHRAAELARRQRSGARVIVMGHTHAAGVWPQPDGRVVINTGSFCSPRGGQIVDLAEDAIRVRRLERRRGALRAGEVIAQHPLVPSPVSLPF